MKSIVGLIEKKKSHVVDSELNPLDPEPIEPSKIIMMPNRKVT